MHQKLHTGPYFQMHTDKSIFVCKNPFLIKRKTLPSAAHLGTTLFIFFVFSMLLLQMIQKKRKKIDPEDLNGDGIPDKYQEGLPEGM